MSAEPLALPPTPPTALTALPPIYRDPEYRRLWTVGMLVGLTRWAEILAYAVFTYELTQSAFWVASLMMLRMLPLALLGMWLGVLAARLSRRRLLLAAYAAMFVTHLCLLLISVFGHIEVWHLAVASAMHGVLWATDLPIRRGLMGDLAGPKRVAQAMSLDAVAASACRLIGPGLGGLLLAQSGLTGMFLLSTLLYLPMLWALHKLREPRPVFSPTKRSIGALFMGGFAAARQSPLLLATLWLTMMFNLFAWPALSMVPVIGQERLQLDPQGVGLLASLEGVGAVLGALLLSLAHRFRHGHIFLAGLLCFMVFQIVLALSGSWLLTAAALVVMGLSQTAFAVMQSTLAYTAAPPGRQAEAMGLMTMCIGVSPLGFLGVGALAQWLGAPTATWVCGVCGLLGVALTWPVCRACLREPQLASPGST